MPSFSLYGQNDSSATFEITLSNAFTSSNYISVGVTTKSFSNGVTSLGGIVGSIGPNNSSYEGDKTVYVTIKYTNLGLDPGYSDTFYGYALATDKATPKYYNVGDGVEVTAPTLTEPSIKSFTCDSPDFGERKITFNYKIEDWDSSVYGTLLIRADYESSAGEYSIGDLEKEGEFTYKVSRYEKFCTSLRITDGKNGSQYGEEKQCSTYPINLIPSFSGVNYQSYPGQKSAKVTWDIESLSSDCYFRVYFRLKKTSDPEEFGQSSMISYTSRSYTYSFDRTGTIESYIAMYHPNTSKTDPVARYPKNGYFTLESSAPNPTVSNLSASSIYGQKKATFSWKTSDVQSGNSLVLYLKHSDDSSFGAVYPSISSTSYTYLFSRIGTYYAYITLINSSGTILSRSPTSGTISVQSTYSIAGFDWTSAELNAFNNKGDIKTLTRTRWNSFLDYVDRCVDYYNAKNGTSYSKLSSSVRMGTDRIMYASSFKEVCQKINQITQTTMSGITLSQIVKGNPIKGAYFPYMLDFLKDRM